MYWAYDTGVGGKGFYFGPDTVDGFDNLLVCKSAYQDRANRLQRHFVIKNDAGEVQAEIAPTMTPEQYNEYENSVARKVAEALGIEV